MSENVKKGTFEEALNRSVDALIEAKTPFKQSDVIANARFNDGSKVGKTTLYKKNAEGSFHYEELMKKINEAVNGSKLKTNKKKKNVSNSAKDYEQLKADYDFLKEENERLIDAIVSQESELKRLKSTDSIERNIIRRLELQLYLTNSILLKELHRSSRAYVQAKKVVENFEIKYRGTAEMKQINNELVSLIENINYTNLIGFPIS